MVAVGGCVYLACENRYVGALLFSVALLTICYEELLLFTGRVGYIVFDASRDKLADLTLGLVGNAAGAVTFGLITSKLLPHVADAAVVICESKARIDFASVFFRAFLCGVLMYAAVNPYKKKNSVVGILVCIPVFILSGFEHSVADMFYFACGGAKPDRALIFTGVALLGNAAGSISLALLSNKKESGECSK